MISVYSPRKENSRAAVKSHMVTDVCRTHSKNPSFKSEEREVQFRRKGHVSVIRGNKTLLHAASFQKCVAALAPQFFG